MGVFASPQFVQAKTARLDLGDGHWIDIKRELSYGDMKDVASATRSDVTSGSLNLVASYLVDWSLTDGEGQPVSVDSEPEKLAALRALSVEAFAALDAAIATHAEATRSAKKQKAPGGRKKSGQTSV
jgi:hypothetical protein